MKTKAILLLFAVMIAVPATLNAQGLLRRAINRQIEHKIDSALDKKAQEKSNEQEQNKNTGNDQTDNTDRSTKATGRGLFGGKIDIKYDDEYKFTGRIYMQIESHDNKDVVVSDYYAYFNSDVPDAGIEMNIINKDEADKPVPTVFIFDGVNKSFMMLLGNDDSKTGIISNLPSDSAMAAMAQKQKNENPEHAVITKTGRSRVIAGYNCDEYKVTDESNDGYANVWMTKDVKLKADRAYWGKAGIPTYYNYPGFEGAMILAMESYDKHDKLEMKMETKEIDEHYNHTISTAGYTFMKMNFYQAGSKK